MDILRSLSWRRYIQGSKLTKAESSLVAKLSLGNSTGREIAEMLEAAGVDLARL